MEKKFSELTFGEKVLSIFCTCVAFLFWLTCMLVFIVFIPLFGIMAIAYYGGCLIVDFFDWMAKLVKRYSMFR